MEPKRLLCVLRLLEGIPVEYMITGSVAAILDVSGDGVDEASVIQWAKKLSILDLWDKATS